MSTSAATSLEEQNRWEKVTHANLAGWMVDFEDMQCLPASPLVSLERMALVNVVLGDDIRFHGLYAGPGRALCIRTSQPHVKGESPSAELLREHLTELGFEHVEQAIRIGAVDAMTFRMGDVWLFDVRPMNFKMRDDNGDILPIDVIVQQRSSAPLPAHIDEARSSGRSRTGPQAKELTQARGPIPCSTPRSAAEPPVSRGASHHGSDDAARR